MSRQAGGRVAGGAGIGSRGPGETKIELDRRRIRTKMAKLRRELAAMKAGRITKRDSRRRNQVPSVVLAGYTNAGKSSLLNRLSGADALVEDALFATLDPTIRRCETGDGRVFTMADTVGFVRQLPHQLVEAFRSTLEEVADASLILHVVDAGHPDPLGQLRAVREVLRDVGADQVPELVVVNKADLVEPAMLAPILVLAPGACVVSAATGEGLRELLAQVEERLPRPDIELDLVVPYRRGDLVNRAHEEGEILAEEHLAEGTRLHARVGPQLAAELRASAQAVATAGSAP
jgi:GTP-binding protein HflX